VLAVDYEPALALWQSGFARGSERSPCRSFRERGPPLDDPDKGVNGTAATPAASKSVVTSMTPMLRIAVPGAEACITAGQPTKTHRAPISPAGRWPTRCLPGRGTGTAAHPGNRRAHG
jgi:hypothetical protein